MEPLDLSAYAPRPRPEKPVGEKPGKRALRIVLFLSSICLVISGVCSFSGGCPTRRAVGGSCVTGEDCASGACVTFSSPAFDRLPSNMRTGICSKPCQLDEDCPSSMYCGLTMDGNYCQQRQ